MLNFSSTIRRNESLQGIGMGGETAMVSIERGRYYALDRVGGRIWQLLAQPVTVSGLVERLQREFEVEPETCKKDTLAFLNEILEEGMLEVLDDSLRGDY